MQLTREQIIGLLTIIIMFLIIRAIFRTIKRVVKAIWRLLTGKKKREDPLHSDDWLTRAQARQEIRFQNALPPLESEMKRRKSWRDRRKEKKLNAEMNAAKEKAKAEERAKFENNPNWVWDEKAQLWRHIGKVDNTKQEKPKEPKPYIPAGWEWDEETKQWLSPKEIAEKNQAK